MRVKIGTVWYDSAVQPICIQVSEQEQEQIGSMDRTVAVEGKYAVFPDGTGWSPAEKLAWMDVNGEYSNTA